ASRSTGPTTSAPPGRAAARPLRRRPPQPESPLVRLLRDPGGAIAHALHVSVQVLEQALPFVAAGTGVLLALALALSAVRRRRGRQLAAGARLVRIGVPAEVDPPAAGRPV